MIGNAVPVNFAHHLAEKIMSDLRSVGSKSQTDKNKLQTQRKLLTPQVLTIK